MKFFKVGQYVRHNLFGVGTILSSNEERTSIDFHDHGTKLFVTSLVQLQPATPEESTPPVRKKVRRARSSPRKRASLVRAAH